MKSNNICVLCIAILLAGYNSIGMAKQYCSSNILESTPATDFTVHNNGTVTHHITGLMWKRCREGEKGVSCKSDPDGETRYTLAETFQQAATVNQQGFGGYTDWRVPNIKELGSIVEVSCLGPSINNEIFPGFIGTDLSFASSTNAIGIKFGGRDDGKDENHTQATHPAYPNHFYLRLVRNQ